MGISDGSSLAHMCFAKVAQNMDELERNILILPVAVLNDLLPHLNIYYLDRIEAAVASKGISTSVIWEKIWRDLDQIWRYSTKSAAPPQDWKQRCLERLFHVLMFSQLQQAGSYLSSLSESFLLSLTVKHVRVLSLRSSTRNICRLASTDLRPILSRLEEGVTSLQLLDANSPLIHGQKFMFILHRLLDHGSVREVVLRRNSADPSFVSWLISRHRGHQFLAPETSHSDDMVLNVSSDLEEPAAKRLALDMEENPVCGEFSSSRGPTEACPEGQIHSLDLRVINYEVLTMVSHNLPTWLCLRTLHLHSDWLINDDELCVLVDSLSQLLLTPGCSLSDLSISHLHSHTHLFRVLRACPALQSLSVEICTTADTHTPMPQLDLPVLSLKRLTIKCNGLTTVKCFLPALESAPKLHSLHIAGVALSTQLVHTIAGSNPLLKELKLEDLNLSDHHQELLHFRKSCGFGVLSFSECIQCRLLVKCPVKKDFLEPFIEALKEIQSLQTLILAQNRMAKSAVKLAKLFSGPNPSKISTLDLSSNFIFPAELLEFAEQLETHIPIQRLTLDLRLNPLDQNPEVKGQALRKLIPFCNIVTDDWDSRAEIADQGPHL